MKNKKKQQQRAEEGEEEHEKEEEEEKDVIPTAIATTVNTPRLLIKLVLFTLRSVPAVLTSCCCVESNCRL